MSAPFDPLKEAAIPWSGPEFAKRHNRKLKGKKAIKAASIASAMIREGKPEGLAIATANARAEGKKPVRRSSPWNDR